MDRVTGRIADLAAEQRSIVRLQADARTFVVAGPGTGKTHTLIHRAVALVEHGVAPSEILVLSFTNAVVGELRRRLARNADSIATYVRPTTIDALAGRIVMRDDLEFGELGFDATVTHATGAIDSDAERAGVTRYAHVIVDEAQDLVGVRLAFIRVLLRASGGGFTVLGDPAQGIYGFADRNATGVTGIDVLRTAFPEAETLELTQDHRSRRPDASPGHELRPRVLAAQDADGTHHRVLARLRDADRLDMGQLATVLKRADATTGVLCRNNGEVLYLSGLLADAGIAHRVRRAAIDRPAPSWIARRLGDVDTPQISRSLFDGLTSAASSDWRDDAWKALRRLAGSRSGALDMQRLREHLHRLNPEEAPDATDGVPVLSTVHRSKGLEYDTAIVLEPLGLDAGQATQEEIRVLYVALTRARVRTLRLERPNLPGRLARRAGRWSMRPWQGPGTMRFELCIGDVDAGLDDREPGSVQLRQQYLRGRVEVGDPVELRLLDDDADVYAIEHLQTRIGVTDAAFPPPGSARPPRITGARIDCLRSAAGDPDRTRNLGIGAAGFWLVPEIVGLGQLQWKESAR